MLNKSKRLISLLLCLVMVLAILPAAAFAAGTTLYVQPNSNWLQGGARFAAYFFEGADNTWVDCVDAGDGLYSVQVPEGFTNIIFCRMNPGTTENNWDNKWNQTVDLTVPADSKNIYVVEGWDKGVGQWIEKGGEIVEIERVYYIRGDMNGWDTDNPMTKTADGVYSVTISLAAGTYTYKAADEGWGSSWGDPNSDDPNGNAVLVVTADCDVTFTLNINTNTITATGSGVEFVEPDPMVIESVVAVGGFPEGVEGDLGKFLNGAIWDVANTDNVMTNKNGVYTISYTGVAAGTYEFKFAANGGWDISWGTGSVVESGVAADAWFNGANCVLTVAEDNSTVTLTLDLSNVNLLDGSGAKMKVDVAAAKPDVLETPKISKLENKYDGVKLTWKAIPGAAKYKLVVKEPGGKWKTIRYTTGTTYTWTGAVSGKTYTFGVCCVTSDGKTATSGFDATGKTIKFIARPSIASLQNTATGVKITWNAIPGAAKYKLVVKEPGGSWKTIRYTANTSYTWTGAVSGKTYTFGVACVTSDGKTVTSAFDATGKTIQYIARPSIYKIVNTAGGVAIAWNKIPGAAKYKIVVKTATSGWKTIAYSTGSTYTWAGATSGVTYTFGIVCVTADGKTVTSAFDSTGKTIKHVGCPKIAKLEKTSTGIKVTWDKVVGAAKYKLIVKEEGGSWKTIWNTINSSYTWTGAVKGKTYIFSLRCITADGKSYTSGWNSTGWTIKYN